MHNQMNYLIRAERAYFPPGLSNLMTFFCDPLDSVILLNLGQKILLQVYRDKHSKKHLLP